MPVTVLLADEQALLREGVASLLAGLSRYEVIGSTGDGRDCVRAALRCQPGLIVFDCAMRGLSGLEAIRRIAPRCPNTRLLCLSRYDDARWVRAAFDAGTHGYVLKRDGFDALREAIDSVMRSRYFISPDIAHLLVDGMRRHQSPSFAGPEGLSARDIAERLHVSVKTVGTHREHIMAKLGIHGIAQLTRYALREGLTTLDS